MKVSVMACRSSTKKVDVLLVHPRKNTLPVAENTVKVSARVRRVVSAAEDFASQPEDIRYDADSADAFDADECDFSEGVCSAEQSDALSQEVGFAAFENDSLSDEAYADREEAYADDDADAQECAVDECFDVNEPAEEAADADGFAADDGEDFGDYSQDEYFSRVEGDYSGRENAEQLAEDLMDECFAQVGMSDDDEAAGSAEYDDDGVMSPMISITRYIDRDGRGGKVEVAPDNEADGKEVICVDVNGKLSRVCGYLKRGGSQSE